MSNQTNYIKHSHLVYFFFFLLLETENKGKKKLLHVSRHHKKKAMSEVAANYEEMEDLSAYEVVSENEGGETNTVDETLQQVIDQKEPQWSKEGLSICIECDAMEEEQVYAQWLESVRQYRDEKGNGWPLEGYCEACARQMEEGGDEEEGGVDDQAMEATVEEMEEEEETNLDEEEGVEAPGTDEREEIKDDVSFEQITANSDLYDAEDNDENEGGTREEEKVVADQKTLKQELQLCVACKELGEEEVELLWQDTILQKKGKEWPVSGLCEACGEDMDGNIQAPAKTPTPKAPPPSVKKSTDLWASFREAQTAIFKAMELTETPIEIRKQRNFKRTETLRSNQNSGAANITITNLATLSNSIEHKLNNMQQAGMISHDVCRSRVNKMRDLVKETVAGKRDRKAMYDGLQAMLSAVQKEEQSARARK